MITSLGLKSKASPHRYKKARYAIVSVSKKYLSKIIREFENLLYKIYERKRPKHEPTDSYFYLARQLVKCIMRADALNSHSYPVRTEVTATKNILTSHICSTDESELKEFPLEEILSQICSTDEDKSKGFIVDEFSTKDDKSESKGIIVDECSTEDNESEYFHRNINKQKDAKNETYYEEYSATNVVPRYFTTYTNVVEIV